MNKINLRCLVLHILLHPAANPHPVQPFLASLSCYHFPSNSFWMYMNWTVNFFAIFINHWRECSWEMQFLNYFWVSFYGSDGWIFSSEFPGWFVWLVFYITSIAWHSSWMGMDGWSVGWLVTLRKMFSDIVLKVCICLQMPFKLPTICLKCI